MLLAWKSCEAAYRPPPARQASGAIVACTRDAYREDWLPLRRYLALGDERIPLYVANELFECSSFTFIYFGQIDRNRFTVAKYQNNVILSA